MIDINIHQITQDKSLSARIDDNQIAGYNFYI